MNPAKVVVHIMKRDRVLQILKLFAERVGQPGKPAHRHAHGKILPLNVARGNMLVVGSSADNRLASAHAYSGAISCLWTVLRRPVNLLQHRKIDVFSKCILDRIQVGAMSVRRELYAAGQTFFQILDKMMSSARVASSDEPAGHKLGIRVKCNPSPNVASSVHLLLDMAILLLRINERPNLVTLDSFTGKSAKNFVLIFRTSASKITEQFHYGRAVHPCHSRDRSERISLNQSSNNRLAFIGAQFVHGLNMLERSSNAIKNMKKSIDAVYSGRRNRPASPCTMKKKSIQRRKLRVRTSRRRKSLEEQYNIYFKVIPAVPDNDDLSLEQPSPFKVFPTETTYGIPDSMFA